MQQPAVCRGEVQCMREEGEMNLREAAQQALEALEMYINMDTHDEAHILEVDIAPKAITALRAALEQPEQEPVAWMHTNGVGHRYFRLKPQDKVFNPVPLYTHPPHREWQGLTDRELDEFTEAKLGTYDLCLEIEASLKEKNT
jgi:hypothetical protein